MPRFITHILHPTEAVYHDTGDFCDKLLTVWEKESLPYLNSTVEHSQQGSNLKSGVPCAVFSLLCTKLRNPALGYEASEIRVVKWKEGNMIIFFQMIAFLPST